MKNVFHSTYFAHVPVFNENEIISILLIIVKSSIQVFLVFILEISKIKSIQFN